MIDLVCLAANDRPVRHCARSNSIRTPVPSIYSLGLPVWPSANCWEIGESSTVVVYARSTLYQYPANTRHFTNVVLMLGRRRRRRANIKTIFGKCFVFAGYVMTLAQSSVTSSVCWFRDFFCFYRPRFAFNYIIIDGSLYFFSRQRLNPNHTSFSMPVSTTFL